MNVTYLIGNGFDLGLGLKTGFEDFLEYYLTVKSEDADINNFKETIRKDSIDLWSDLELKFGNYIANFNKDNVESYIKIYEDVTVELNKYIKSENGKIFSYNIDSYILEFIKWIVLDDLKSIGFRADEYRTYVNEVLKKDVDFEYNFMSFNYTRTIDKILKRAKQYEKKVATPYIKNLFTHHKLGELIHIHGEIDDYLIMGVNDEKQLPFPADIPDFVKDRMIKVRKNIRVSDSIDEKGTNLIINSNIICLYGLSLGATDSIWWERIGKWLENDYAKFLIIFMYNSNLSTNPIIIKDYAPEEKKKYLEKFLDIAKVPDDKKESISKKIIIVINSNFMQINLVEDEKEAKNKVKSEVTV